MSDSESTIKWFGESWGAPICEIAKHTQTPLGTSCAHGCGHSIRPGDIGVLIPAPTAWPSEQNDTVVYDKQYPYVPHVAYHLVCFFDEIGMPVLK